MSTSVALREDQGEVLEVVQRLWRTKFKSITLVEKWMAKTTDFEIKAGLKMQLADERRHLRILGDEIKRLGGRISGSQADQLLERPFALIQAQSSESQKLSAFYRGLKAYTVDRCSRLLPMVDRTLARTLEQISREEEGHIRWADIRLARIRDVSERREVEFLVDRMEKAMEAVWTKRRLWLTPHHTTVAGRN